MLIFIFHLNLAAFFILIRLAFHPKIESEMCEATENEMLLEFVIFQIISVSNPGVVICFLEEINLVEFYFLSISF